MAGDAGTQHDDATHDDRPEITGVYEDRSTEIILSIGTEWSSLVPDTSSRRTADQSAAAAWTTASNRRRTSDAVSPSSAFSMIESIFSALTAVMCVSPLSV